MSRAFSRFMKRHDRAKVMLDHGTSQISGPNADTDEGTRKAIAEEICRAGVVLAVAAMDAYFTEKYAETWSKYILTRGPTEDMIKMLEKSGFNTKFALELLSMKKGTRPFRKIRTLIEAKLDHHVTQNLDIIDELYKSFSLKDLTDSSFKRSGGNGTLKSQVIELVKRRHEIVHEGDLNDRGKLNLVNLKLLARQIEGLKKFVSHSEEIINNACKTPSKHKKKLNNPKVKRRESPSRGPNATPETTAKP